MGLSAVPTLGELGRDYRAVVKAVTPGRYTYVTSIHDRRRYSLFQISIWDDAIDEHLIGVLELSSRKFKDNTVLFLNLARDLMVSLKIRGHHAHYLIEPRPAAQRLVAARLGLSVDGYERLVLEGGLRDLVLRDVAGIRRRYGRRAKSVPAETRDAAGKRPEPTDESGRLETATVALMARLGQGHSRGLVNRDVLASKDAEIAALRGLITRGGRLRRDSVSVPLSGSSAGWVHHVSLPGPHAGRA